MHAVTLVTISVHDWRFYFLCFISQCHYEINYFCLFICTKRSIVNGNKRSASSFCFLWLGVGVWEETNCRPMFNYIWIDLFLIAKPNQSFFFYFKVICFFSTMKLVLLSICGCMSCSVPVSEFMHHLAKSRERTCTKVCERTVKLLETCFSGSSSTAKPFSFFSKVTQCCNSERLSNLSEQNSKK